MQGQICMPARAGSASGSVSVSEPPGGAEQISLMLA
jgi:hypothetical protein